MPALDKINIKGFKSIRSMEGFELKPLNVLIGANGAGKSNFIGVFKLLNEIVQENLQVYVGKSGGADQLLHYGHKTTEAIHIHLQFGQNAYECTLTTAGDTLIFEEENVFFHNLDKHPSPYRKSLRTGYKESVLPEKVGEQEAIALHVLAAMQGWKIYHFNFTEESFIRDVLHPHLGNKGVLAIPVIVATKRVKAGADFKGGITSYGKFRKEIRMLLADTSAVCIPEASAQPINRRQARAHADSERMSALRRMVNET